MQIFDLATCKLQETVDLPSEMMPYTCRFTKDMHLLVGGKFVNSKDQGSMLVAKKSGDSDKFRTVWQDHDLLRGHILPP